MNYQFLDDIGKGEDSFAASIMEQEIRGCTPSFHKFAKGEASSFSSASNVLKVVIVTAGGGDIVSPQKSCALSRLDVFASLPGESFEFKSSDITRLVVIGIVLSNSEVRQCHMEGKLPHYVQYCTSQRYKDSSKSDKTISRKIIPPNVVPRFCMGSVETVGPDVVEPHSHPMLDQFFLTLPDTYMHVLINGNRHEVFGNTLLHIPLGSSHGVEVNENNHLHYFWLDFFFEQRDMKFITETHTEIDTPSKEFL